MYLLLLKQWFQKYPEFLANPFYISGESYAGVYVPTLAFEVANGMWITNRTRYCMLDNTKGKRVLIQNKTFYLTLFSHRNQSWCEAHDQLQGQTSWIVYFWQSKSRTVVVLMCCSHFQFWFFPSRDT